MIQSFTALHYMDETLFLCKARDVRPKVPHVGNISYLWYIQLTVGYNPN